MHNKKISLDEILLFLLLVFGPLAHGLVETWSITIASITIIFLVAFAVLTRIYKGELRLYRTPTDIPILLFFLSVLISYCISVYPYASRIIIYKGITGLALFFYTVNTQRSQQKIDRLLWVIVIIGTVYAVMGLTLVKGDILGFEIYSRAHYNISLFFVNHNHFAGYLEMVTCLAIGLAIAHKGGKRLALFGMAVLTAAALFFSLSRGGIIAFIGGLSFYIVAFSFLQEKKRKILLPISFALFVLAILVWFGLGPVLERLGTLDDPVLAGGGRVEIWQGTLKMIAENPLFGRGPGTFSYAFPQYQTEMLVGKFINYTHNDYLELASDTGLIGLACFLCFLLVLFTSCLKRLARTRNTYRQAVGVGALSASFSIIIHSITDCNLQIFSNLIVFALAAGIAVLTGDKVWGRKEEGKTCAVLKFSNNLKKILFFIVIIFMTCLGVGAVLTPYLGDKYLKTSWEHQHNGDFDKAVATMKKAIFLNPDNAKLVSSMGDILLTNVAKEDNYWNIKNCTFQKQALRWYETATKKCSVAGYYFNKKGMMLDKIGRIMDAENAYKQALRLYPMHASTYYNMAYLYLKNKRIDDALPYYRRSLELGQRKEFNAVLDDIWSAGGDYEIQKRAVPKTAGYRHAFAAYLRTNGEKGLAEREIASAFSLEPTARNAFIYVRELYRSKKFVDALATSEKYLSQFPENVRLREQYAVILEKIGQNREAMSVYRNLLDELTSKDVSVKYYIFIARLYAKEKVYKEAVSILQQGIEKKPYKGQLYYPMGLYLRSMKKKEEALTAFKKAVALRQNNVWYRYQLGVEYQRNGLEPEALKEWKTCLVIKAGFAPCSKAIKRLEKKFGLEFSGAD